jgi:hypothetical protein
MDNYVLGEFSGFHAVLRRKTFWGNWNLVFFGVLPVGPRRDIEEGDPCVFLLCFWGNFIGSIYSCVEDRLSKDVYKGQSVA